LLTLISGRCSMDDRMIFISEATLAFIPCFGLLTRPGLRSPWPGVPAALLAASISSSLSYPTCDKLRDICMVGALPRPAEPGFLSSLFDDTGLSQMRHLA
jgi:hypothetical protein